MRRCVCRVLLCCVCCLFLRVVAAAGEPARGGRSLLVVPERFRIVQLAFDLHRMRPVSIVSYRGDAGETEPLLHLWTDSGWERLDMKGFSDGSFLEPPPDLAILVGDDRVIPSVLPESIGWPCRIERLETLLIADLVNGLDRLLDFRPDEWKRLSGRYELILKETRPAAASVNPYAVRRSELPVEALELRQRDDDDGAAVILREKKEGESVLIEKVDMKPVAGE